MELDDCVGVAAAGGTPWSSRRTASPSASSASITLGNRQAAEFLPLPGVTERELADAARLPAWPKRRRRRLDRDLGQERFDLRGAKLSAPH